MTYTVDGHALDATVLAIASPGVFGPSYIHDVGEVLAASAGGPPDPAAAPSTEGYRGPSA